jgi:hypothetical protein
MNRFGKRNNQAGKFLSSLFVCNLGIDASASSVGIYWNGMCVSRHTGNCSPNFSFCVRLGQEKRTLHRMEKVGRLAVLALFIVPLVGCQAKPPAMQIVPVSPPDYSRFLPYPQATGLALDTKTGLLCHTFNPAIDTVSKGGASTMLPGQHLLDSVPLCIELSQNEEKTIRRIRLANLGLTDDNK